LVEEFSISQQRILTPLNFVQQGEAPGHNGFYTAFSFWGILTLLIIHLKGGHPGEQMWGPTPGITESVGDY